MVEDRLGGYLARFAGALDFDEDVLRAPAEVKEQLVVYRAGIMSTSTRPVQALRLGSLILQPVSDGAILQMDPASIFRDARPEEWQTHVGLNAQENIELGLTCLLVQIGDRHILIDTGYGVVADRPEVGHLAQHLAETWAWP